MAFKKEKEKCRNIFKEELHPCHKKKYQISKAIKNKQIT